MTAKFFCRDLRLLKQQDRFVDWDTDVELDFFNITKKFLYLVRSNISCREELDDFSDIRRREELDKT